MRSMVMTTTTNQRLRQPMLHHALLSQYQETCQEKNLLLLPVVGSPPWFLQQFNPATRERFPLSTHNPLTRKPAVIIVFMLRRVLLPPKNLLCWTTCNCPTVSSIKDSSLNATTLPLRLSTRTCTATKLLMPRNHSQQPT